MATFAPDEEQSEFNQAIASLYRIHSALIEIDIATLQTDLIKQYKSLLVLYKEVYPLLNDKERQAIKPHKIEADLNYALLQELLSAKKNPYRKSIHASFEQFELQLRDYMHKHKLGLVTKGDAHFALSSRR